MARRSWDAKGWGWFITAMAIAGCQAAESKSGFDSHGDGLTTTSSQPATSGTSTGTTIGMSTAAVDDSGTTAVSSGPTGTAGETSTGAITSGTTLASTGTGASSTGAETGSETGASSGDVMPQCDCAPGTDLIYVLADNAELWSFDPLTNQFQRLSSFLCGGLNSAFSMGVDRNGTAWLMLQNRDIYTIDITTLTGCYDPGYTPNQMGFGLFGMAYVSDGPNNPCDRLYAQTFSGMDGFTEGPGIGQLGSIDPETLQVMPIGPTDYNGGELTGTGDGRLFAFAGANPAKLIEFDKSNANVLSTLNLDTLELTNAFAFAFYGGDFYFFTENASGTVSQVTHIDYDDSDMDGMQQLEVVVDPAPIRIVGAGVSTCVPVVIPQ